MRHLHLHLHLLRYPRRSPALLAAALGLVPLVSGHLHARVDPQAEPHSPPPPPPVEVRQRIYRVPLLQAAALLTRGPAAASGDDAAILAQLQAWHLDGRATLRSDMATSIMPGSKGEVSLSEGRQVWLPTELDQDFDRLFMPPTAADPYLAGTLLQLSTREREPDDGTFINANAKPTPKAKPKPITLLNWKTEYAERDPLAVKWPASWLEYKHTLNGWINWYDTYEESLEVGNRPLSDKPFIIAAMPSALHVWDEQGPFPPSLSLSSTNPPSSSPAAAPQRMMDIIVADAHAGTNNHTNTNTNTNTSTAATTSAAATPSSQRIVYTGIVIPSTQAFALLHQQQAQQQEDTQPQRQYHPSQDNALYQTLLAQAGSEDTANANTKSQLRFCMLTTCANEERMQLASGRRHSFPTEMPSIPSAWDGEIVGTRVESGSVYQGYVHYQLDHHLAPPRRQVWRLSLTEPELIMWEPIFRRLQLVAASQLQPHLSRLIAMMKVPAVIQGHGVGADHSLLVFATLSGTPPPLPPAPISAKPLPPNVRMQMHLFELPATELGDWQPAAKDAPAGIDNSRFYDIIKRATEGTVRLAGHGLLISLPGQRAVLGMTEEINTATEFDPPTDAAPHRMRPTALDNLPTGTSMEIDVNQWEKNQVNPVPITLNYIITHATALPEEPALEITLPAVGVDGNGRHPDARQYQVEWRASADFHLNETRCLGAMPDPASITATSNGKPTRIIVAFLSVAVE